MINLIAEDDEHSDHDDHQDAHQDAHDDHQDDHDNDDQEMHFAGIICMVSVSDQYN